MVNPYGHNTQLQQLLSLFEVSFTASFTEKYLLYINKIEDPPLPLIYTLYPLSSVLALAISTAQLLGLNSFVLHDKLLPTFDSNLTRNGH